MQYRGLELDRFQAEAIEHLRNERSVLVCAPTGTGKTLIADWIVDKALSQGRSVVYTAPIKALSNQKFRDYTRLYGAERVGLVTGDLVIRHGAPCRVMTTEILRNMLLAGDQVEDLAAVILDEIHFLDDRERGTVWEEVLIYLPKDVLIVGLSATLSNLRDFADWLEHVRGAPVAVVEEHQRAVPLEFFYAAREIGMLGPQEYERRWQKWKRSSRPSRDRRERGGRQGRGRHRGRSRGRVARHTHHEFLVSLAQEAELLPCLYFAFSRRNCERYARDLLQRTEVQLLDSGESERMERLLAEAREELGDTLDSRLQELYRSGVAFHHAGLHVQLKTLVERLYEQRLIKVLYCTSTFALGINMPARAVIFDAVEKYDGTAVRPLPTRAFMQKAGRAGRRGMDDAGSVILRMELEEYDQLRPVLARFARGAYEPVRSSFSLSWSSVVNLLHSHEEGRIREIIEKSFLSWNLAREADRHLRRADALEAHGGKGASKRQKEARRLRRRSTRMGRQGWSDFQARVSFLREVGYLGADAELQAGARVLLSVQIAEIEITEIFLSGILEELDPPELYGVLCGLVSELPRAATPTRRPTRADRRIIHRVGQVVDSPVVLRAADITRTQPCWDPQLYPLGRAWAEGTDLDAVLLMLQADTDVAGDLVGCFRRAKDLAKQLRDVHAELPDRVAMLNALIREVSRDEVEVVG